MRRRLWDSGGVRVAAIGGMCVLSGAPLTVLRGSGAAVFALLSSTLLAVVAGVMCVVAARRTGGRGRAGWTLLGAGSLSWGLGNAFWSYNELVRQAAVLFPSPADYGFLGFPVFGGLGLWLISGRSSLGSRLASVLDGLIVSLALFMVSWTVTLRSVWETRADSGLAFVVSVSYPLGDVVLATMAILLAARTRRGSRTVAALLILGLLGMAAADTLFAISTANGSYLSGALSDAGWVVAFAAFALAGLSSARRPMALQETGVVRRWQLFLPYLPFGAAGLISYAQSVAGVHIDGVQAVGLTVGFALIMSRQLLTLASNSVLTEQLGYQAFHDPLTGLGNRAMFADRLADMLAGGYATDSPAVLYLDLDDFKLINDTLGHDTGDALLCAVADRIRAAFPHADVIARLGGDEFVVLLGRGDDPAGCAQHLLDHLREPFVIGSRTIAVTASVGAAAPAPGWAGAEDLRKNVDLAMYAAKQRGKNAYAVFEPSMRDRFDAEMSLREELHHALAGTGLYVVYQPIVDLTDGRVVGVEALARWRHATRGEIPPAEFIPVAERAAMIADIGDFVLRRACSEFAGWAGSPDAYLSVNASPLQLLDPAFADRVQRILQQCGLRTDQLVLEITETALADESYVIPALRRVRAAGVRIAIDDFGTGYSSLRYLHRLPADIIKIDRSYVQDIDSDPDAGRLVETMWQLFSALGLTAVAEGIEHPDQALLLAGLGCPMAQGYLFGRPVEIGQVGTKLAAAGPLRPLSVTGPR